MSRPRIILPLVAAVLLAATAAVLAAPGVFRSSGHEKARRGLEMVLRAESADLTSIEMADSVRIIDARFGMLGFPEREVRARGSNEVVIKLPGRSDLPRRVAVVATLGQLQIFDLETSLAGPSLKKHAPRPLALYPLLEAVAGEVNAHGASGYYLFDESHKLVAGPAGTPEQLNGSLSKTRHVKKSDTILATPKTMTLVACDAETSRVCPAPPNSKTGPYAVPAPGQTWYYLFNLPPNLEGKDLKASGIRAEFGSGGPQVDLAFNGHGNKVFQEITREEWNRGKTYGDQHFAIVLDSELITFPRIDSNDPMLSDGIDPSAGGTVIEGVETINEARDIATVLRSGALPASFRVVVVKRTLVTSGD